MAIENWRISDTDGRQISELVFPTRIDTTFSPIPRVTGYALRNRE